MTSLRAVVFDFDGTLADTASGVWAALAAAAQDVGCSFPAAVRADSRVLQREVSEIAALLDPPAPPHAFATAVTRRYRQVLDAGGVTLHPGMADVLEVLSACGLLLAVLSKKEEGALHAALSLLPEGALFRVVRGRRRTEAVGDARAFKSRTLGGVLDSLGVAPVEAAHVGDAPGDVLAARDVGMRAVGVLWGDFAAREVIGTSADATAATAEELLDVLCGWSSPRRGEGEGRVGGR